MSEDTITQEDDCTGWKNPEVCPHDGKYDPKSVACEECYKDALAGMKGEKDNGPK